MHKKSDTIIKKIPLSNNTVSRRIDEIATDVKHQLIQILQCSEFFIQVDESTVIDNQCLMMVNVRYSNEYLQPCEEMLFTENLLLDSKGTSIFNMLKRFLSEHHIPLTNIIACASDGTPAMVGRYRGKQKILVDCKSFITTFISKLVLYKINISKRQLHQFPQLDPLKDELVDEDIVTYRDNLQPLHDDMTERFQDVITLNIPNWYKKTFEVQAVYCEDDVQKELIELQNDNEATMRYRFHGKEGLWYHQSILNSYPNLFEINFARLPNFVLGRI
ncbi:zinc finger MYM-type protein 6-like [Octopus bimaculoides]|uniref:zinc finger MYM-type protein 6-like n=1 Tax=Octopus bimaculoides TaxID=37653 RepID=UPI00071DEDFF|nr:zinc finger MYM-type protein 6-like [Octopus bimaculoides]|eukprot:XP_014767627.1 PREDICTED: zinc finger MYM-type protein 6-like [Octopus bimaculoides]